MSSDAWWNSAPPAEGAAEIFPSSEDPTNAYPEETGEDIPLQPRNTLNPTSPKPAPPNTASRTNLIDYDSASPAEEAAEVLPSSVDLTNAYPEETEEAIPLQPRNTLSPNSPRPAPPDITSRTNHVYPSSRSPSPYRDHPTSGTHPLGSNDGHGISPGRHGPGYDNSPGYGAGGGGVIDPDTPEWSTYHHDHTHKKVDRNTFKRNMTIAKGFLDISLLSANSNQLRNLLYFGDRNEKRYYVIMSGLIFSLFLQIVTGVLLIFMERWNINKPHHKLWSLRLNNTLTVLVFLTLIINCLVSSMGVDVMQHGHDFQQNHISRAARSGANYTLGADRAALG